MLEELIVCQAMESYQGVKRRCSEVHFIKSSLVITLQKKGQIYIPLDMLKKRKKMVAIRKKYIFRSILVVEFMELANESEDDRIRI